jgi:flagellar hook-associated protein 2
MATIQFGGVSSGLDTAGIIDALMRAEKAPLTRLLAQKSTLTSRQAAIGDVRNAFADVLAKLRVFTDRRVAASMIATSSTPTSLTATATSAALAASHQVAITHLATATVARSTAPVGTAVTDGSATLASLPLAGAITAGQVGIVVDGTIVRVAVGDPATTSLDDLGAAIAAAIGAEIARSDPGASVSYAVAANRIQLTVAGASGTHTVAFGTGGDTSNALRILGLAATSATVGAGGVVTGTSLLGVVQANATLADALPGAGAAGTITINGTAIAWDAATDTLATVLSRINAASTGVIASIDRATDRVVLSARTPGAVAIDIADSAGGLGAALGLAPGTTAAQALGTNATVVVNGTTYTSPTNQVTNAIEGVTLNLLAETAGPLTLTVGGDRAALLTALKDLVTSFNAAADLVAKHTANVAGTTPAVLAGDSTVAGLLAGVRSLLFSSSAVAGPYANLGAIGLNTGAVGSRAGSTSRLQLDEAKLVAALDANPAAVAELLGSATGALAPIVARINAIAGSTGVLYQRQQSMTEQLGALARQQATLEDRFAARRASLEKKYAAMEATLSGLQALSAQLAARSSQSDSD